MSTKVHGKRVLLGELVVLLILAATGVPTLYAAPSQANIQWPASHASAIRELGLRLDVQPLESTPTILTGVLRSPERLKSAVAGDADLAKLMEGFDRGYRVEFVSPTALTQKSKIGKAYAKLKGSSKQWGLLFSKVRGAKAIEAMPAGARIRADTTEYLAWGRERGIELDHLTIIGHVNHGKSTLVGTVDDVSAFNALGLGIEGVEKGDRVHIVPPRRTGWQMVVCSSKNRVLLLLEFGQVKMIQPEK